MLYTNCLIGCNLCEIASEWCSIPYLTNFSLQTKYLVLSVHICVTLIVSRHAMRVSMVILAGQLMLVLVPVFKLLFALALSKPCRYVEIPCTCSECALYSTLLWCFVQQNRPYCEFSIKIHSPLNCSEHVPTLHDPWQKADSYINALVQALKKVQYESIK